VELLSNKNFLEEANHAVEEDNVYPQMYSYEFIQLSSNIGFLLPKDDIYVVNKCHELYSLITHPHSDMLLGNRAAIGILHIVTQKTYLQCVPIESLNQYTGYIVEELEKQIQLLKNLRFIQEVQVIDGKKEHENILKDSKVILSKIQMMKEYLNNNKSITTDELKSVLEVEGNNETYICLSEESLMTYINEAINTGTITHLDTKSNISLLEEGDTGYRMNDESDFVKNIGKISMTLLGEIEFIREHYMEMNLDEL